jgi:hypothetical protein
MHAFNPSSSGTWAVDVGISGNASSAADPVIATGITTLTDGALVIGHFYCPTGSPPITYSALTELWTAIGGAYYRNLGGADMTIATVYRVFASHGATGNISYDKSNNYDTSEWAILAFKCTP